MKFAAFAIALAAIGFTANVAFAATTDDVKWINRCLSDNKDEGASREVVLRYCTCMNNKMSENETQSITSWEKTHVRERKECDREAGWR